MWLLYQLIEETDTIYRYAYSRETNDLDGIIVYDKKTGETTVEKPCAKDKGIKFSINHAAESFEFVIDEGFPARRMVAFG